MSYVLLLTMIVTLLMACIAALSSATDVQRADREPAARKIDDISSEPDAAAGIQEPYVGTLSEEFNRALYLHVPSHIIRADVSPHAHPVRVTEEPFDEGASLDPDIAGHKPWVSRNDLTHRAIEIDLGTTEVGPPLTISLKLMPGNDAHENSPVIMRAKEFVIEESTGEIGITFYDTEGGELSIVPQDGLLDPYSSNHLAIVVSEVGYTVYLNGKPTEVPGNTSIFRPLKGELVISLYPGKVWDLRIDRRALSRPEILEMGGSACADNPLVSSPYEGYPNRLCGVYVCEWWPDDATETLENYRYYLAAQDAVYERNIFEASMFPPGRLCDYINTDPGRHLQLDEGIRKTFVRPWSFEHPLQQSNGQHWLHENFHSFQGRLAQYNGFGGSKFLLESTASWGADHNIPGVGDTLLAYYSMHPHLPLWTIQNSPVDMRAGHEFKGGHQYGAYIFWSYLTRYVTSKRLIGKLFNDRRSRSTPVQVAYELLAQEGHDMKSIFGDFAARITTWDIQDGEQYARSEQASLRRMRRAKPDAGTFDNKITAVYGSDGTGDRWTSVPEAYIPGSWAFNAFRVDASQEAEYVVALRTAPSNPAYADFQARIVVHDERTGERVYDVLDVAEAGQIAEIAVPVKAGDTLYLIVATTPDVFTGWDWYRCEFRIYPQ